MLTAFWWSSFVLIIKAKEECFVIREFGTREHLDVKWPYKLSVSAGCSLADVAAPRKEAFGCL